MEEIELHPTCSAQAIESLNGLSNKSLTLYFPDRDAQFNALLEQLAHVLSCNVKVSLEHMNKLTEAEFEQLVHTALQSPTLESFCFAKSRKPRHIWNTREVTRTLECTKSHWTIDMDLSAETWTNLLHTFNQTKHFRPSTWTFRVLSIDTFLETFFSKVDWIESLKFRVYMSTSPAVMISILSSCHNFCSTLVFHDLSHLGTRRTLNIPDADKEQFLIHWGSTDTPKNLELNWEGKGSCFEHLYNNAEVKALRFQNLTLILDHEHEQKVYDEAEYILKLLEQKRFQIVDHFHLRIKRVNFHVGAALLLKKYLSVVKDQQFSVSITYSCPYGTIDAFKYEDEPFLNDWIVEIQNSTKVSELFPIVIYNLRQYESLVRAQEDNVRAVETWKKIFLLSYLSKLPERTYGLFDRNILKELLPMFTLPESELTQYNDYLHISM